MYNASSFARQRAASPAPAWRLILLYVAVVVAIFHAVTRDLPPPVDPCAFSVIMADITSPHASAPSIGLLVEVGAAAWVAAEVWRRLRHSLGRLFIGAAQGSVDITSLTNASFLMLGGGCLVVHYFAPVLLQVWNATQAHPCSIPSLPPLSTT